VDARLPDGSRVNAAIPPVAVDGPLLSIRRFGRDRLTVADLVNNLTLTGGMMDVSLPQPADSGPIIRAEAYTYHQPWITKTPELYDPPVRAAILSGAEVKVESYARAREGLAQSRREIRRVFSDIDLLVFPTMADPPFKVEVGFTRNVSARNTLPFDVFGIPVISIPCGFTSAGLPIGLQIAGPHWGEPMVLALAQAYERATDWHTRHPKLG